MCLAISAKTIYIFQLDCDQIYSRDIYVILIFQVTRQYYFLLSIIHISAFSLTYVFTYSFFHLHRRYHKILRIHCGKSIDYVKFKIINLTCKIFLFFIFDFFYIIQFKILFSVWGIFKRCKMFDIHQVILHNNDWDYNDHTNE